MPQVKLGELFVKAKLLTEAQLKHALNEQARWGGKLGEVLVRMNAVNEQLLVKALAKQLSLAAVDLDEVTSVPAHVLERIPPDLARRYHVIPLQMTDGGRSLVVAMADPLNIEHLDALRSLTRCRIWPQIGGREAISRAIPRLYRGEEELNESEAPMKIIDAHGKTVQRDIASLQKRPPSAEDASAPGADAAKSPRIDELLAQFETAQAHEVAQLKGLIELLVAKGVFTAKEYSAKVKAIQARSHGG